MLGSSFVVTWADQRKPEQSLLVGPLCAMQESLLVVTRADQSAMEVQHSLTSGPVLQLVRSPELSKETVVLKSSVCPGGIHPPSQHGLIRSPQRSTCYCARLS
jgi:hypothetical protein